MLRAGKPTTVNQLCDLYQVHANEYYQQETKAGQRIPTGHATCMHYAMVPLRAVAGDKAPMDLQAEDLYEAQQWMLNRGLSRTEINNRTNRARQVIRWAAKPPRRWVSAAIVADMGLVESLERGRTSAKENPKVTPVSYELVTNTMAAISPGMRHLYLMLDLHWATGMRPCEIVRMERDEFTIERPKLATGLEAEVMVYRPFMHKTKHHGFDRHIFLGPEARRIVEDWMRICPEQQLWPYDTNSYRQAVVRTNKNASLPHWFPGQIRHSFATRMRSSAGIDVVQVLMGHCNRKTTEIYALPDCSLAIEAILKFG